MTENEAKIFIQNAMEQSKNVLAELMLIMPKVFAAKRKSLGEYYSNLENCKKEIQSCEVAIKALEEVQQYRALETRLADMFGGELSLEDVTDELERYLKEPDNAHPINAKILTYEDAAAWDAYRAIGTPEECLWNKDFLDFLSYKMKPGDFETYLRLYNALEEKGCEVWVKNLRRARYVEESRWLNIGRAAEQCTWSNVTIQIVRYRCCLIRMGTIWTK